MALTSTVFPSTEHVVVFFFFCLLRVLEVFGLNATLIFSLIIIIIIIIPFQEISSKSVHDFFSYPTDRQTDKQTEVKTKT